MDRIEPKWIEWTEYNQCGPNRAEMDIIGQMWIE